MSLDPSVDPNAAPPDPMLDVHDGDMGPVDDQTFGGVPEEGSSDGPVATELIRPPADPYAGMPEVETRERVELCCLIAIEQCANAVKAGKGAENPQYVVQFGQAAASLAQAYQALATVERKEQAPGDSQYDGEFGQ